MGPDVSGSFRTTGGEEGLLSGNGGAIGKVLDIGSSAVRDERVPRLHMSSHNGHR